MLYYYIEINYIILQFYVLFKKKTNSINYVTPSYLISLHYIKNEKYTYHTNK